MPVVFNTPQPIATSTAAAPMHHHFPLASFMRRPFGIYFANQQQNEIILLFLRKHPITQVGWILASIILIVAPFFLFPIIQNAFPALSIFPPVFGLIASLLWYLIAFVFIFIKFILWYYNVNIVTNRRIIDIDFPYLLVQEQTETDISHIEDVTEKRAGALSTIFDYGNVFVQTAGTEVNIEFLQVPHPRDVTKVILDLMGNHA